MPLYEYRCNKCGHQFEKIQSFSAPDEKECPVCQGQLERLISRSAIQFKGSGWYASDYGRGGVKPSADKSESGSSSGESKKDGNKDSGSSSSGTDSSSSSKS